MPFLNQKCPICNKLAVSEAEFAIGSSKILRLKCGHVIQGEHLVNSTDKQIENLTSLDDKKLFHYQCEGVNFVLKSGVRCLIADEMRLGKTVQALGALAMNESELLPFVAFVKKKNAVQWQRETMRWLGEDKFAQVVTAGSDILLPGAIGYIMSYDLPRRFPDLMSNLKTLGVKTVILDECQQIKNTESQRARYVRELFQFIPHVIALSGTPIKNNTPEYFSVLNILRPSIFPKFASFIYQWCDTYYDRISGKYKTGGLARPELFHSRTKDFILRRTRAEVKDQINLSVDQVTRRFVFNDLSKEVEKRYEIALEEFLEEYENSNKSFSDESNILSKISKLRYLTGLSKVDDAIDFAEEFLTSTDRKLAIFVHHKDVGDIINLQLTGIMAAMGLEAPVHMPEDAEKDFALAPNKRIAILSTLAHGEGTTLPTCSDALMVERQWNPANEEQAEARFIHVDQKADIIECTYLIAVGTIDEMFSELVERKREIVTKTLGGSSLPWDQSSLIGELGEMLLRTKRERWSYR